MFHRFESELEANNFEFEKIGTAKRYLPLEGNEHVDIKFEIEAERDCVRQQIEKLMQHQCEHLIPFRPQYRVLPFIVAGVAGKSLLLQQC